MKLLCNHRVLIHRTIAKSVRCRVVRNVAVAVFALVPATRPGVAQQIKSQASLTVSSALRHVDRYPIIYVSDFELEPANFKHDKGGLTGKGYVLPPPPKSFLRRKQQDPAKAANNLVELMSISLVRDLQEAGFFATRLLPTDPRPQEGLVVTGVFTQLDEGNQMRRALLGFGSGKAKMELAVTVADVSSTEQRLYEASSRKSNGKGPGSLIALNPYVGAARFVVKFGMTKSAPEKMVKDTASRIAKELARQLTPESLVANQAEPHATH